MTLSVQNTQVAMGADVYYQEAWQVLIDSHLLFLMQPAYVTYLTVNPHDAFKYEGDLWSLLQSQNVPPQYHFPIMRANGLYAPQEYTRDMTTLIIPAATFIDQLRNLYLTVSSKLN